MSQALILTGGVLWIVVILTMAGYSSVLAGSRNWRAATAGYVCTLFVLLLGVMAIENARYWAQTWVW